MIPLRWPFLHILFLGTLLFNLLIQPSIAPAAVNLISGDKIQSSIKLRQGAIVNESDSLFISGRLLRRDFDYKISYLNSTIIFNKVNFIIDSLHDQDTLRIQYTPLPLWLSGKYGNSPASELSQELDNPGFKSSYKSLPVTPPSSKVTLNGAKKFSIRSQTGGNSQLDQTLDFAVTGELFEGVNIVGSITDRSYDPQYGVVNSQISELDKLRLKIYSDHFSSEIGNLELLTGLDTHSGNLKQMSGLRTRFDNGQINSSVTLARPRGQFRSIRFYGRENDQGPYRISDGSVIKAIVPGSEKVWLDGQQMERGADKDYTLDYPAASISFTPRHPINSRRRIEIDYEPLENNYQREFYQMGGGFQLADSTIFIKAQFTGEGDNKDRLKIGELGPDQISLLSFIGDTVSQNFLSGVTPDTNGNYILLYDPDSIVYYQYVSDSSGGYSLTFSYVGTGAGDYLYRGGDIFEYIGPGRGDYLPLATVPVPARLNQWELLTGFRPSELFTIKATIIQSDYDKNLYSTLDDNDNTGGQYKLSTVLGHNPHENGANSGLAIGVELTKMNFRNRTRRFGPEFDRTYYLPNAYTPASDEYEISSSGNITPPGYYNIFARAGYLEFSESFKALRGEMIIYPKKTYGYLPRLKAAGLKGSLGSSSGERKGNYELLSLADSLTFKNIINFGLRAGYDRRWNLYTGDLKGTTEYYLSNKLNYRFVSLTTEYNREDTLTGEWQKELSRKRVAVDLADDRGALRSKIYFSGQRSDYRIGREDQFLARADISYHLARNNFKVNLSYTLADENRFERGLRYIEVEPGQGKYIFENNQYIPDPNGNYILIDEIHSSQSEVNKGEKSISLLYNPRSFNLRLSSRIVEELLAPQSRSVIWVLPFYSDDKKDYLHRKNDYSLLTGFVRGPGFYYINIDASYNYESRRISDLDRVKYETALKLELNQGAKNWRILESGILFRQSRDAYYFSPGIIDGYKISLSLIKKLTKGQIKLAPSYRYAEDKDNNFSKQYILTVNGRLRFFKVGESSLEISGYFQDRNNFQSVSYRLTDNLQGRKGINWSIRSSYKLSRKISVNMILNGRHSDDSRPQIIGRGELVARF